MNFTIFYTATANLAIEAVVLTTEMVTINT